MAGTGEIRRSYQLRVWHGMTFSAWRRMLCRHRFRISAARSYRVVLITLASLINSALAIVQELLLGRTIDRTPLPKDPVFVLGHWRSGTTLLHQLLSLDSRHVAPSTYACLAPGHFLISQKFLAPCLRWLLPTRRSQDDVRVDFEQPQEDEWALSSLGLPSLYQAAAFPNSIALNSAFANFDDLHSAERRHWLRAWRRFLRSVVLRAPGKRLVIKSPLHLARLDLLLEAFPEARFVHVVREPVAVFSSTLRLWQRLAEDEGLQKTPALERLRPFVLQNYVRVYRSFEQNRHRIPPNRLCEIRYEDLVGDPTGLLRTIYERLDLGPFDSVRPAVELFVGEMSNFKTNRGQASLDDAEEVSRHWGEFAIRYGYGACKAA